MAQGKRYNLRQDANQASIIKHINRLPFCKVIDLSGVGGGCPDILVQKTTAGRYLFYLIELKTAKGKLNPKQKEFHDEHHCFVARTLEDIWRILDV